MTNCVIHSSKCIFKLLFAYQSILFYFILSDIYICLRYNIRRNDKRKNIKINLRYPFYTVTLSTYPETYSIYTTQKPHQRRATL